MKILYCNKYNFRFSGTEAYLFDAMGIMKTRGHEVALFSMQDSRGEPSTYDHNFVSHIDFKSHALLSTLRSAARGVYSIHARRQMRRMIDEFSPDIAHVRNIYHHLTPSILWELKKNRVPVLFHINDLQLLCPSYNMVSRSGDACERCAGGRFWNAPVTNCYSGGSLRAAGLAFEAYFHRWLKTYDKCVDLILAPSEFVKQKLIENGWSKARIRVLGHFQSAPLQTAPFPGRDAPILYFGRLSPEKGVADSIFAMQKLPWVRLVIAGDGPQGPELRNLVHATNLKNVTFGGQLTGAALEKLIAESQFTIFPSRAYETFGKSILESYAHGRAVIASDRGSRRELVQDNKTGLLYEVGNIHELAEKINFLYVNPGLSQTMGEQGLELVRSRYSQERHFPELEQTYRELVDGRFHHDSKASIPAAEESTAGSLKISYIGGRGVVGKYSGIETYYEETGKRLAALGHIVTVYCRPRFTPDMEEHNGVRIVRLPTIYSKHLETFIHTLFSTLHASFSDCDVVHFHTLGSSLFSFVPRIFGKKTLVTVQGLDWQRKKWSWFARSVLRISEWTSAKFPSETVVVSRTLAHHYRAFHRKQTVVIPNGTALRGKKNGSYLRNIGLTPNEYVLFLGRFSPEKNCHLLIEAFEGIDTTMKLVLAGGSSHTDNYAAELRRHESSSIKILNWLSGEALEEVLTNATVFVLPSDMEGLSLALLDAMAAGLCVLASDTPENREVIHDCGFTFQEGDVEDLRRMLTLLLSDRQLRESSGRRAQARIEQNYLWDEVTKRIENFYRNVVLGGLNKTAQPVTSVQNAA